MAEVNEQNLKNLQILLAAMSEDHLGKKDFLEQFEKVIELVLKIEKRNSEAITRLEETYKNLFNKMDSDHSERFKMLKGQMNELFVGDQIKRIDSESKMSHAEMKRMMNGMIEKKMAEMDMGMEMMKNTLHGETKKKKNEMDLHLAEIKLNGKIDVDKQLTFFKEEIKKDLRELKEIVTRIGKNRAMGRAKVPITRAQNLTSQVDGVVNTFTLAPDTVQVFGIFGTQFPVNFNQDVDWTFAGRTLTLVTAQVGVPQSGQTLWALTEVLFYP